MPSPGAEFTVIAIDYQGPVRRFQNITAIKGVDLSNTKLDRNAWQKATGNTLVFSFPEWTPDLRLHELMEIWIGYKLGNRWDEVWFGGYCVSLVGRRDGMEHIVEMGLHTYDILFDRTAVLGWPSDPTRIPASGLYGYPVGYSARDWCVGQVSEGKIHNGIVPYHFNHIDLNGVDPEFRDVIFLMEARPLNQTILGWIAMTNVRGALDLVMNTITYYRHDMRPTYFMKPIAIGDQIVPQFRLIDQADKDRRPDFTFSDNPTPGQYYMEEPWTHSRDATDIRTRVDVKGVGLDPLLPDHPLVFASVTKPEGMTLYKTYYQEQPGWAGEPVQSTSIETVEMAGKLAEKLIWNIWGPRGTIEFDTDVLLEVGNYVRIIDSTEGLNGVYPVMQVTTNRIVGRALYHAMVGFKQLGLQDIMGDKNTIDLIRLSSDRSYATKAEYQYDDPWSGTGNAAAPASSPPLNTQPSASAQNGFQAVRDSTTLLNFYTAANTSGYTADGQPIKSSVRAAPAIIPAPTVKFHAPDRQRLSDWYDENNENHPHHYPWMFDNTSGDFPDQTQDQIVLMYCSLRTMMIRGTATSVTITNNDVDQPAPTLLTTLVNGTQIWYWAVGVEFERGDLMGVRVAGMTGASFRVSLSEIIPQEALPLV